MMPGTCPLICAGLYVQFKVILGFMLAFQPHNQLFIFLGWFIIFKRMLAIRFAFSWVFLYSDYFHFAFA